MKDRMRRRLPVTPSLEKIWQARGDDDYYEGLQKQMDGVALRKKAIEQVATYWVAHGKLELEVPF